MYNRKDSHFDKYCFGWLFELLVRNLSGISLLFMLSLVLPRLNGVYLVIPIIISFMIVSWMIFPIVEEVYLFVLLYNQVLGRFINLKDKERSEKEKEEFIGSIILIVFMSGIIITFFLL
ncbi:hypothetical protein GF336_00360 [Candidatus Woesearchaeota archaeon]|nr:hypothetical protein [Candidatus Woesearchaeota archaeon]